MLSSSYNSSRNSSSLAHNIRKKRGRSPSIERNNCYNSEKRRCDGVCQSDSDQSSWNDVRRIGDNHNNNQNHSSRREIDDDRHHLFQRHYTDTNSNEAKWYRQPRPSSQGDWRGETFAYTGTKDDRLSRDSNDRNDCYERIDYKRQRCDRRSPSLSIHDKDVNRRHRQHVSNGLVHNKEQDYDYHARSTYRNNDRIGYRNGPDRNNDRIGHRYGPDRNVYPRYNDRTFIRSNANSNQCANPNQIWGMGSYHSKQDHIPIYQQCNNNVNDCVSRLSVSQDSRRQFSEDYNVVNVVKNYIDNDSNDFDRQRMSPAGAIESSDVGIYPHNRKTMQKLNSFDECGYIRPPFVDSEEEEDGEVVESDVVCGDVDGDKLSSNAQIHLFSGTENKDTNIVKSVGVSSSTSSKCTQLGESLDPSEAAVTCSPVEPTVHVDDIVSSLAVPPVVTSPDHADHGSVFLLAGTTATMGSDSVHSRNQSDGTSVMGIDSTEHCLLIDGDSHCPPAVVEVELASEKSSGSTRTNLSIESSVLFSDENQSSESTRDDRDKNRIGPTRKGSKKLRALLAGREISASFPSPDETIFVGNRKQEREERIANISTCTANSGELFHSNVLCQDVSSVQISRVAPEAACSPNRRPPQKAVRSTSARVVDDQTKLMSSQTKFERQIDTQLTDLKLELEMQRTEIQKPTVSISKRKTTYSDKVAQDEEQCHVRDLRLTVSQSAAGEEYRKTKSIRSLKVESQPIGRPSHSANDLQLNKVNIDKKVVGSKFSEEALNTNILKVNGNEHCELKSQFLPDCKDTSLVTPGCRVAVYWDGDDDYFTGTVTKLKPGKKRGFRVKYDDGEKEWVNLNVERFRLLSSNNDQTKFPVENDSQKKKQHAILKIDKSVFKNIVQDESDSGKPSNPSKTCSSLSQKPKVDIGSRTDRFSTHNRGGDTSNCHEPSCSQPSTLGIPVAKKPSQCYLDRFSYKSNAESLKHQAKVNKRVLSTPAKSEKSDENKEYGVRDRDSTFTRKEDVAQKSSTKNSLDSKIYRENNKKIGCWTLSKDSRAHTKNKYERSGTTEVNETKQRLAFDENWVSAGIKSYASDSDTDEEEVMQWASKVFGLRISHHNNVNKKTNQPHLQQRRFDIVSEEEKRKRKEEARPLTAAEINAILGDDSHDSNDDTVCHWVRRSSRQPCKSALKAPKLVSLLGKLKNNDADMVVLKMKKYCPDSATPSIVVDTVLEALEENTNCEALYIQNFNLGMRDKQVLHLLGILQRPSCKIWCLNIGETYNVRIETWEAFAEGLKDTKITHMYASEHTISTELKDEIRETIRQNRRKHTMHIDPNNLDTIIRCTHCWWNPCNAFVLRPYIKKKGYDSILLDAEAQGLPGTMSEGRYLI